MLIGDSAYIHGEAFRRLVSLLDSLERNEWRWIVVGPRNKSESYHWEGYAPHEHRPGFKVDFTTTTISLT